MDEYEQLTTSEVERTDLAEIGNAGHNALLSTCELLGGRTLQISRDTGCDLLTRERSSRKAGLLRDNGPTVCWFRVSCALWCPWRWKDSDASERTYQKLHRGRRLIRAALQLATQLLDTGGLFVWEWPRGCQACELPEMKMFQKHFGQQLLYSNLDTCELGVRVEKTRMLARKEWTFMTNSDTLHKILNLRCSHQTKHAWWNEVHAYDYPVRIYRRVVQLILKMDRWNLEQQVLQQAMMTPASTAETVNSSEHDEATL